MIAFLVAASEATGIADAHSRGWTRIAMARFATPDKHDVRVIRRVADLHPMAGKTPMIKGSDYEDGPSDPNALDAWIVQKEHFDRFVAEGNGEWIDLGHE